MDFLNTLTPVSYFDVVSVSEHGLNPFYILLSFVIILVSCFMAGQLYTKKDLRPS